VTVYPRLHLRITLEERALPPDVRCRNVERSDAAGLGELMLAAYRGTVDDEGETREDAVAEVERVLDGSYGPFRSDASFVVEDDDGLLGASLVTIWESRPLLLYLVVRPDAKRRGAGTALLVESGNALAADGHAELDLFVTEANEPAVNLYRKLGFRVIERVERPSGDA
jgi:ribosomal protein S18 acetylase RimI-like enzyme